jgi:hypothetical protein
MGSSQKTKMCSAILTFASTEKVFEVIHYVLRYIFPSPRLASQPHGTRDIRATCFMCYKAAMMGENITTDTPCSTPCLRDWLPSTSWQTHINPTYQIHKTDYKVPISAIFTYVGQFMCFSYQKLGCIKYQKKNITFLKV